MANRHRLRVQDFTLPSGRQAMYIDDRPNTADQARKHRHTVRSRHNPFHDGLDEGKRSGMDKSRRVALGLAKNGSPHHSDVACDRRTRQAERDRERREAHWRKIHRKIDPTLI